MNTYLNRTVPSDVKDEMHALPTVFSVSLLPPASRASFLTFAPTGTSLLILQSEICYRLPFTIACPFLIPAGYPYSHRQGPRTVKKRSCLNPTCPLRGDVESRHIIRYGRGGPHPLDRFLSQLRWNPVHDSSCFVC